MINQYQVGGSLHNDDPNYVTRNSDEKLYKALRSGEFCYVFNTRQMGKTSLLVRAKHRLEAEGYRCTTVDMNRIGSEQVSPLQWYKGIVGDLWRGFSCMEKLNLKTWWQEQDDIPLLQKLSNFIEELLLKHFPEEKLCIFIDEIDSILSLSFSIDDFFALIRYCYNQRSLEPEYNRITFALFGVTTPSDLIRDKNRTPFNIGQAIELHGFSLEEVMPLAQGLKGRVNRPDLVIKEIIQWTDGQPFLTQKICQLIVIKSSEISLQNESLPLDELSWIESLICSCIIYKWESQDEPEHLRTIRDRILKNQRSAGQLLSIYQRILQGIVVYSDDSREQIELLLSGLVIKNQGILQVKNQIYKEIFNPSWVEKQLSELRPYSQTLDAWIASNQTDSSRLLRGQALMEAQIWSQGKSLDELDYQFIAASVEFDRKEIQRALEVERLREVDARLAAQKKSARLQKFFLIAVASGLIVSSVLGLGIFFQYRQATLSERQARLSEIQALVSSSEGLFASHRSLDALVDAIKAKRRLQKLGKADAKLQQEVNATLQQAVYGAQEYNNLSGHTAAVVAVDISPDSSQIASASIDKTVKIWRRNGSEVVTLKGHKAPVRSVDFRFDGQMIVSASDDETVKLWHKNGTLLKTFRGHNAAVWGVAFSPDGQTIASSGMDGTVKLWKLDGTLLKTFRHTTGVWRVAFSPDGQMIASTGFDTTVKLWKTNGTLLTTLRGHSAVVESVAFSPDGQTIASASGDKQIKLWRRDGTLLTTLKGHTAGVQCVVFSPDGRRLVSSSADKTLKIWNVDGTELNTLRGHTTSVWSVAWSSDGSFIASAGSESIVKLWQSQNPFQTTIVADRTSWAIDISSDSKIIAAGNLDNTTKLWNRRGELLDKLLQPKPSSGVFAIAFSPDGKSIVSASDDKNLYLWTLGKPLPKAFSGHKALVLTVAYSPDGRTVASGSQDNTVKLWRPDGTLLKTFIGHEAGVWQVTFSPDSRMIASASGDGTVKLWNLNGKLLKTFKDGDAPVWRVGFNPNGQTIASGGGDKVVKLWKLDGKLLKTFKGHQGSVWGVAFSPNGQIVASGSVDNTVKLWWLNGKEVKTLRGHTSTVRGIAVSRDGTLLASVSEDNSLILWNISQILNLDALAYGCDRIRDYLHNNLERKESERHLCDRNQ